MIFNTADYLNRADLEQAVINKVGTDTTIKEKSSYKIVGSIDDLKRLSLSVDTSIFGVTIEIG